MHLYTNSLFHYGLTNAQLFFLWLIYGDVSFYIVYTMHDVFSHFIITTQANMINKYK